MKRKYFYPKQVNSTQLIGDRFYYDIETLIQNRLQSAPQFIKRLELDAILDGHQGCVNCLEWSDNGRLLASASDDYHVMIWDPFKHKRLIDMTTQHHGNIFSVKFMPKTSNSIVITGAADCLVYVSDLERNDKPIWSCNCHTMRVKRLATAPESPHVFWSSGEDGNVLQFDTREPHTCRSDDKVLLISLSNHLGQHAEVKCIAINQRRPEMLAVGSNDTYARVYDRRMITLSKIKSYDSHLLSDITNRHSINDNISKDCVTYYCPGHFSKLRNKVTPYSHQAITYLTFSPDGTELLVNMGTEQIYLYDINNAKDPVFLDLPQYTPKLNDDNTDELTTSGDDTPTKHTKSSKHNVPENVEFLKKKGNEFLENEKYLQAIYQYTAAIHITPDYPVLYLNRATAYMRRNWYGDIYAALRDCNIALKLDPSYIKAHFRLARALLELGYVQESSDCLDELKKRFPSYAGNNGVLMLKKDINSAIETNKNDATSPVETLILSDDEMYWRAIAKDYKERFVGHCNTTTDIKEANFFGSDGNYIIAGSDDGNFFIWERPANMISNIYKGDMAIVNCVQPHPNVCLLATSGIDNEIRLWTPQPEENFEPKNKVVYFDRAVLTNQHRMQNDPFDINTPNAICRTS